MPRFYFCIALLLGLLGSRSGWAQQTGSTISGDFRGLRFEQFAQQVEAQTPYRPATIGGAAADFRALLATLCLG
jgi:hypothetical protein